MTPSDPDVAGVLGITENLTDAQRVDLANRLVLQIKDVDCRRSIEQVARNATIVGSELHRSHFANRNARGRIAS